MNDEIFQKLRAKIDTYAIGFPATQSGVEIDILKKLFTAEEAEIGLNLSMMPEPVEVIAARIGQDPDELVLILAEMVRKGSIFNSLLPDGTVCFHGAPFMHGLSENQAGNMDPEMARLLDRYEEEGYLDHLGAMPMENILRFSPVNEAVTPELTVASYNQVEELLKSKTKIAAIP